MRGSGQDLPGLEIKLVTGSIHLVYFQDEHDRERFINEIPLMPILMHRCI